MRNDEIRHITWMETIEVIPRKTRVVNRLVMYIEWMTAEYYDKYWCGSTKMEKKSGRSVKTPGWLSRNFAYDRWLITIIIGGARGPKARFPLPEFTARVHWPSWRPVNSGAFFDTRQLGPSTRVSINAPEFTGRQLGPWTRVVETGL